MKNGSIIGKESYMHGVRSLLLITSKSQRSINFIVSKGRLTDLIVNF